MDMCVDKSRCFLCLVQLKMFWNINALDSTNSCRGAYIFDCPINYPLKLLEEKCLLRRLVDLDTAAMPIEKK